MKYHIMLALRTVTDKQLAEVAVRLADIPEVTLQFEHLLIEVMNGTPAPEYDSQTFEIPNTGSFVLFTKSQLSEIQDTARAGNKVAGIKAIRLFTNIGLKEAKDLWEDMETKKILDYNRDAANIRRY